MPARGTTRPEAPRPVSGGFLVLLLALPGEGTLELETRRRVFVAVNRYPGLSVARLARVAELDEDLVRYHLRVLERASMVRSEEEGGHRRIYPLERTTAGAASPISREDRGILSLLRRPPVLRAVVALLDQGPLSSGELAGACGVAPSTASHHIKRMEEGGLIRIQRQGRQRIVELADPKHVVHLLSQHPPPEDLVQDFIETWDDLGF